MCFKYITFLLGCFCKQYQSFKGTVSSQIRHTNVKITIQYILFVPHPKLLYNIRRLVGYFSLFMKLENPQFLCNCIEKFFNFLFLHVQQKKKII